VHANQILGQLRGLTPTLSSRPSGHGLSWPRRRDLLFTSAPGGSFVIFKNGHSGARRVAQDERIVDIRIGERISLGRAS
jgi:hypothetical protein